MESQDGIIVRPMRLKVLYTFDNENKTNCLARWPHVLDIQSAYLDEQTQVGVIELKTCIQAIVSASPELVAQLGKDYTVYAYDYSEYETPLVGQGMLSWVLASTSPTPEAPAHQSKTMVTGRVCKNPLGLFSRGAQETLEVRLRLVPVPTVMQNEYRDSMQKYRESSNVTPQDFDAQSWTKFLRQNPGLMGSSNRQSEQITSPMDQSGIERFHQLLSEGSTPRDFDLSALPPTESVRSASPALSYAPSRVSTPGGSRAPGQQQQPHFNQGMPPSDVIRPSSSASMRDTELPVQPSFNPRRESVQSEHGSGGDELAEPQPRKRAKVFQAGWAGKYDMNIERQPSSLRVAASTAASVRIHRPTPVNPSLASQRSIEEPIRPPTPISRPTDLRRRSQLPHSLLRESSANSASSYTSPYSMSDDHPATDQTAISPDESHYQGLFEPSFTMPSSPPIMDSRLPTRSSPVLPPLSLDTDSGFMSGGFEDLLEDDVATPLYDCGRATSNDIAQDEMPPRSAMQPSSPASAMGTVHENTKDPLDGPKGGPCKNAPPARSRPATSAGSRPSSRASVRQGLKPLAPAPAPVSQNEVEQLISAIPASDPIAPTQPHQHSLTWTDPMSDFSVAETPGPLTSGGGRGRSAAARRQKQVQHRLDQAIRAGQVPPYCENCGSIETPTWRRAWTLEFVGGEDLARQIMTDSGTLFWESLERDDQDKVSKFKVYKKSVAESETEWAQILLCNPCGLWLHKCKGMRPENMWNTKAPQPKRKRPSRSRKGGPLSNISPATRTRSKVALNKAVASSPAPTEASSVPDEATPDVANDDDNDNDQDEEAEAEASPNKRRRANSAEPRRSTDSAKSRWDQQDAMEALRRAIQSSPARNMEVRNVQMSNGDNDNLTPKPVRRVLFPHGPNEGPLKELDGSVVNSCSPRRSPRIASKSEKRIEEKENVAPTPHSSLESLFQSPTMDFDLPSSPTPRRRSARPTTLNDKRAPLPCNSPSINKRKAVGSGSPPSRPSAEGPQHVHESHANARSVSRQHRSPNKQSRAHSPSIPSWPDDGLHSEAFESLDGMILDIFDNASSQANPLLQFDHEKFSGDNWADWLPAHQASPLGSDDSPGQPSDDLFNAILSDPDIHKETLHNSEFNPFNFGDDSGAPDSGFFSSDALHGDPPCLEPKTKISGEQRAHQQAASPAS